MQQNINIPPWPAELAAFPEMELPSGSWECADVGEYDGVKLNCLYVRDCGREYIDSYLRKLSSSGFSERQRDKYVMTAGSVKLCVDICGTENGDGGFCIFFSSGKVSSPVTVTPRRRAPGWRKARRRSRRFDRRCRRVRKRSVRKQRRQNRRCDRRTDRRSGE